MDDITKSDRYSGYDISKIDVSLFTVAKQEEADTYEEITTKPYNYWGSVGKGLIRKRTFDVSFILVLVIVLLAIIVPIGKVAHPIDDYYAFAPPSWDHLFGIGNENEDYWITLWIGTNQTLYFVGLIIVVQILLGTGIGLLWGYQKLYSPAMEWIIKIFKHIPQIVLWVVVVYLFDLANQKNNMFVVVLAVSVTSWVPIAEKISVSVRRTRLSNLYNSSMSLGLSKAKIFSKTILVNLFPIIFQTIAITFPEGVATDTTLSFFKLGFVSGSEKTITSLGYILNETFLISNWETYPHLILIPAAMIIIISLLFYYIAHSLSVALNVKNHS